MKIERGLFVAAALLASAVLAACGSTGPKDDPRQFSSDQAGDEPLENIVRIVEVDRSTLETDGTVRYRLANVSGEDQESLAARVIFYYPPTQQGGIALPYDTDVTVETTVVLFKGQDDYVFSATSRTFADRSAAGDAVLATRIDVQKEEPIAMVARDGATPGTRVLNGQLECVGISDEDLRLGLDGAAPQLWLDFENVGREALSSIQIKVLFLDTQGDRVTGETGWHDLPELGAGERGRVDVELDGAGTVRNRPFLVRVRQSSGLFG